MKTLLLCFTNCTPSYLFIWVTHTVQTNMFLALNLFHDRRVFPLWILERAAWIFLAFNTMFFSSSGEKHKFNTSLDFGSPSWMTFCWVVLSVSSSAVASRVCLSLCHMLVGVLCAQCCCVPPSRKYSTHIGSVIKLRIAWLKHTFCKQLII